MQQVGRAGRGRARAGGSTAAGMASDGRTKRSQSICAPASASMEALAAPAETPPAPRRRPATRSQSARITGGRSVRHRRTPQQQQLDRETRARYSSEPRLAEAETPPQVRRQASARRRPPPGASSQPRRSNAFLDVPRAPPPDEEPDEDSYRLRTFNTTQKGGQCYGDRSTLSKFKVDA
ncbi:unnamed protein product [Plutella xylostella]|nr:unnamed protein product [Plutella xylostella]